MIVDDAGLLQAAEHLVGRDRLRGVPERLERHVGGRPPGAHAKPRQLDTLGEHRLRLLEVRMLRQDLHTREREERSIAGLAVRHTCYHRAHVLGGEAEGRLCALGVDASDKMRSGLRHA